MPNFTDQMAKLSDAKLVKITTVERNLYDPAAVAAAETELQKRNLTNNDVAELLQENINLNNTPEKRTYRTIDTKLGAWGKLLSPFTKKTNQQALTIIIVGLVFIELNNYGNFFSLFYFFTSHIFNEPADDILFRLLMNILPLLVYWTGIVLLAKVKKLGWILIVGLIIFGFIDSIFVSAGQIIYQHSETYVLMEANYYEVNGYDKNAIYLPSLESIYYKVLKYFTILLKAGTIIFLTKGSIIQWFNVSTKLRLYTILIAALGPIVLALFMVFLYWIGLF